MVQRLSALPYACGSIEPYSNGEVLSVSLDEHPQTCLNDFREAQEMLGKAQRNGDLAAIRAICDDLARHYSGLLLDSISLTNLHLYEGGLPDDAPANGFQKDLGSWESITQELLSTAYTARGSGWAVLAWQPNDLQLVVLAAEKHQSHAQWGVTPILALDVRKDAYYLCFLNSTPSRAAGSS